MENLPLQEFFKRVTPSRLGLLPTEATYATVQHCIAGDVKPGFSESIELFKDVPAILLEIPVDAIKAAFMSIPDIADHGSFEQYHRWYMGAGDVPAYNEVNRWPCIASLQSDEVVQDGHHRLHAYIAAGHQTIPVLQYDCSSWWEAHDQWMRNNELTPEKPRA